MQPWPVQDDIDFKQPAENSGETGPAVSPPAPDDGDAASGESVAAWQAIADLRAAAAERKRRLAA